MNESVMQQKYATQGPGWTREPLLKKWPFLHHSESGLSNKQAATVDGDPLVAFYGPLGLRLQYSTPSEVLGTL